MTHTSNLPHNPEQRRVIAAWLRDNGYDVPPDLDPLDGAADALDPPVPERDLIDRMIDARHGRVEDWSNEARAACAMELAVVRDEVERALAMYDNSGSSHAYHSGFEDAHIMVRDALTPKGDDLLHEQDAIRAEWWSS